MKNKRRTFSCIDEVWGSKIMYSPLSRIPYQQLEKDWRKEVGKDKNKDKTIQKLVK